MRKMMKVWGVSRAVCVAIGLWWWVLSLGFGGSKLWSSWEGVLTIVGALKRSNGILESSGAYQVFWSVRQLGPYFPFCQTSLKFHVVFGWVFILNDWELWRNCHARLVGLKRVKLELTWFLMVHCSIWLGWTEGLLTSALFCHFSVNSAVLRTTFLHCFLSGRDIINSPLFWWHLHW